MTVSEYTRHLLSFEEYSFSLDEAIARTSRSATSVKGEIARLVGKGEVSNLRKGFYLIIPPRYSNSQKLPIHLYADKLFAHLNRTYYVGLYTAAKFHGASHQQSQREYVMIEIPKLNNIKKHKYDIQFHTTSKWPQGNIEVRKMDAGPCSVSSPDLTFVDLVSYHRRIGGLNRMLPNLMELTEVMDERGMEQLTGWYENKSSLQRAGFLLEELIGVNAMADVVYAKLEQEPFYPVLLTPESDRKPGSVSNRWKVDVNLNLDSDL